MPPQRAASRADASIGERQERLLGALQRRVDALDCERPRGLVVELRDLARLTPPDLVIKQCGEGLGTTSKVDDPRRHSLRLNADRDGRRPRRGFRSQQP
jgi:hypothetical protein